MTGHGRLDRRTFLGAALLSAVSGPSVALAQPEVGEKKIDPLDLPLDKPGTWTLYFRYKSPRIVTLDGFGKDGKPEKKIVWYMWYQVYNLAPEGRTPEPVTFLPEFELVTKDLNTSHLDEPQPHMVEQLNKIENTENLPLLNLRSSITFANNYVVDIGNQLANLRECL